MISVDGIVHVFDIFDPSRQSATFNLPPCNMPCLGYDGSLNVVLAPFAAYRIHHFKWDPLSSTSKNQKSKNNKIKSHNDTNSVSNNTTSDEQTLPPPPKTLTSSISSLLFRRPKRQRTTYIDTAGRKAARSLRRYSSYNEYGYACQARTAYYIKQVQEQEKNNMNDTTGGNSQGKNIMKKPIEEPDFHSRLRLVSSIRTSPLGWTTRHIVSMAVHNDRVAIVNRRGAIALFALNGTTAADVMFKNGRCPWHERDKTTFRDGDDLSDGYDFVRSRLVMGDMGVIYGGRDGKLWWLDFSCRPDEEDIASATPITC
ncbi:hypothetical protein BDA99DRAFT_40855 [Phascolomyces articulosus]|uniref:Uncharacterized protein n=1 Tax=Phascolomyces articulosus TaxID=60185 RepID=A0AAD5PEU1_9FUNG|nr:hypothetical protein BDA99DRAFT_40855 [Phascolomyces articulosus]